MAEKRITKKLLIICGAISILVFVLKSFIINGHFFYIEIISSPFFDFYFLFFGVLIVAKDQALSVFFKWKFLIKCIAVFLGMFFIKNFLSEQFSYILSDFDIDFNKLQMFSFVLDTVTLTVLTVAAFCILCLGLSNDFKPFDGKFFLIAAILGLASTALTIGEYFVEMLYYDSIGTTTNIFFAALKTLAPNVLCKSRDLLSAALPAVLGLYTIYSNKKFQTE